MRHLFVSLLALVASASAAAHMPVALQLQRPPWPRLLYSHVEGRVFDKASGSAGVVDQDGRYERVLRAHGDANRIAGREPAGFLPLPERLEKEVVGGTEMTVDEPVEATASERFERLDCRLSMTSRASAPVMPCLMPMALAAFDVIDTFAWYRSSGSTSGLAGGGAAAAIRQFTTCPSSFR